MSLRVALLGLLSEGPATGYELIKDFDVSNNVIWSAPKGEVYRELARLQADGFARPDKEAGVRRSRKWHVTAKGQDELRRWLRATPDYSLRYDPMLRAVFLGQLGAKDIREKVAADRAFFKAELAALLEGTPAAKNPQRRYGKPMAILFYEAMLAWCDAADALARKRRSY